MVEHDFNKVAKLHFIEITPRHKCFSVNLLDIFRILFPKNTSGGLLLFLVSLSWFLAGHFLLPN